MYKAEISFALFKILGAWPATNTKGYSTINNVYTAVIVIILVVLIVSNSFSILRENVEMDEYREKTFLALCILCAVPKVVIIYWKHNKIQEILDRLAGKQFEPRDSEELSIQSRFDKIGRWLFKLLVCIIFWFLHY